MGHSPNRGTKDKPKLVRRLPREREVKYRPSHQPTKAPRKRFVQEIEGRIARGMVDIEDTAAPVRGADRAVPRGPCQPERERRPQPRAEAPPAEVRRMHLAEITLATVTEWIGEQCATGELSEASIRHNMN